tara:strand:+ start:854 stop:1108 length:255 start_codon:yes stop_codon:yes gene_type:complete
MGVEIFLAAAVVMGGCAYTSYRIGFREGSGAMVDYVRSKRNKSGYTTMHFFGDKIEFVDQLEQLDRVLTTIADKVEDETNKDSA